MAIGDLFRKKKKDTEGQSVSALDDNKKTRDLPKTLNLIVSIILFGLGMYHLYIAFFGANSAIELRATHWTVISTMVFLMYPAFKKGAGNVTVFDWAWAAMAAASGIYILFSWQRIAVSGGAVTTVDIVFGCIAVLVVLEATRRTVGAVLAAVAAVFLLYAFFGHVMPGMMGHRRYTVERIIRFMYTGTEGIYGPAMNVSANYVALFVLFGSLLEKFGGGELFVDLAYSLTGRMRGGPAKASVVSSALMGTMSGSAVANVVTTGAFTIPLMKKNGYAPKVAGAVEAVASTGGQIMPPVMGAAAFLMAEVTGIPYSKIMVAALLPAFMYFLAIFLVVDLEALKMDIGKADDSQIKKVGAVLKHGGYLMIPLLLLIVLIFTGYSAIYSCAYSIAAIVVIDLIFSKERKQFPKKFFQAVLKGVKGIVSIACACAAAGLICGVISLTGVGSKFSSMMISVAQNRTLLALLMTMVASLILGCGLPTTAAYMVLATLAVPALTKLGLPLLASHLFVLYFGSISTITPPVALSAYAGAAIAGADPNKVGYTAFRFGIVAFIVPFIFVYNPALLMEGSVISVIISTITALIGTYAVAVAVEGYWKTHATWLERILAFVGGCSVMLSGWIFNIAGLALIAAVVILQLYRKNKPAPAAA